MTDVSVIIPTYNRTAYLEEAVRSILDQTCPVLEIIIVNDGSSSDFVSQIEQVSSLDERIRVINNSENRGVSASRNIGTREAKGGLICFLDDDDVLTPEFVEKMRDELIKSNSIQAVLCDTDVCTEPKRHKANYTRKLIKIRKDHFGEVNVNSALYFIIYSPMIHSFLFRKEVFEQHRFPEEMHYGEDIILWISMVSKGVQFKKLNYNGGFVRIHEGAHSERASIDEKIAFHKNLYTSGLLSSTERQAQASRLLLFMLSQGRLPSFGIILEALKRPLKLISWVWFYIKVMV